MQSLFIITSNEFEKGQMQRTDFYKQLSTSPLTIELVRLDQLQIVCGQHIVCSLSEKSLQTADWIYFRRLGDRYNVMEWQAVYAAFPEKKYLTPLYVTDDRSKLVQMVTFQKNNLTVPKTIFFTYGSPAKRARFLIDTLGLPVVEKYCHGAEGKQVRLYRNKSDLTQGIKQHGDAIREVIFQEYIPNNGDYRVVVLGNTVRAAGFRTAADGEWRNNVCLGGSVRAVPLPDIPPDVVTMAEQASKVMRMPIAGVDIVQHADTKGWYILEVNHGPGMKTPGVATAYAKYFRETILTSSNDQPI